MAKRSIPNVPKSTAVKKDGGVKGFKNCGGFAGRVKQPNIKPKTARTNP